MADEDESRFYIGDEVRVREGLGLPEMKPALLIAVAEIGDIADRRTGQTVTVIYRDFWFCAANLPARISNL